MVVLSQVGEDDAMNTTDVNKTAKVVAVGPTNEYGKTYKDIKMVIIFDAYVEWP
jgi:hypothetical protein